MSVRPASAGVGILTPQSPAVTVAENMVNFMRRLRLVILRSAAAAVAAAIAAAIVAIAAAAAIGTLIAGTALAGSVPQEPEQDNMIVGF